jgi:UDP-N-acetylglucosamine 1-carboxyvinyltransferase
MSEITEQVAKLIQEARKARGLTQEELGNKLGLNKATINKYESGKQNLTIETLYRLMSAMGENLVIKTKK